MYGDYSSMLNAASRRDYGYTIESKQENGVVVTVFGEEQKSEITLPQLQKTFAGTSVANNDITYQVKSFSFISDFVNVRKGDKLMFWGQARWGGAGREFQNQLDGNTQYYASLDCIIQDVEPLIVELNPPKEAQTMSVVEYADLINKAIPDALANFLLYEETDPTQPGSGSLINTSQNRRLMWTLLYNVKFRYDALSGKMVVDYVKKMPADTMYLLYAQVDDGTQTTIQNIQQTDNFQRWDLVDFSMLVTTAAQQSVEQQNSIARMMGMQRVLKPSLPQQGRYALEYRSDYMQYALDEAFYAKPPTKDIWPYVIVSPKTVFTLLGGRISDAVPYNFIMLRTTGRSNVVFGDGHRENILQTFPIEKGQSDLYQTFQMETALYSINDTIEGVRSMIIEFVDENDTPIVFNKPYLLKIAIFFRQQSD